MSQVTCELLDKSGRICRILLTSKEMADVKLCTHAHRFFFFNLHLHCKSINLLLNLIHDDKLQVTLHSAFPVNLKWWYVWFFFNLTFLTLVTANDYEFNPLMI